MSAGVDGGASAASTTAGADDSGAHPTSPARRAALRGAIAAWDAALGGHLVVTEASALEAAATTTFALARAVTAIVRPGSLAEVQACVRVARAHGVPLYPISGGRNAGYGSRVPTADGCALLDLSRMNRVLDFSETLAYVTVEPGVTQAQLRAFLRERGSRLWMDATGASPASSIVGNVVERGFGHTPYGDRFAHTCGLQVVLPDGEVIETGFARFAGSPAAPLYRWGVGPSLDGLFTQSNLGIVTRLTQWLMPAPERTEAFFFRCDDDASFAAAIDAIRPLKLDGTLRSAMHIGNDYKVLSGIQQYPWDATGGATPLRPAQMAALRARLGFGARNGSGALYGTAAQVSDARRRLKRALAGKVSRLQFLDERKLALATSVLGRLPLLSRWDLSRVLDLVRPVFGLLRGEPTEAPQASCYWRKRTPPPADADPDRDRCGLLWCAPVAPLEGAHAARLSALVSEACLAHGFEPMVSMTAVSERALTCVVSLVWDRDVPGDDARAHACHDALMGALRREGYHPYRLGVQSMDAMDEPGAYTALLQRLKAALDPGELLAPGRYVPAAAATTEAARAARRSGG